MTRTFSALAAALIALMLSAGCDDGASETTPASGAANPPSTAPAEPAAPAADELTLRRGDQTRPIGSVLTNVLELPFGKVAQIRFFEGQVACDAVQGYIAGNRGWRLEASIPGEFQDGQWQMSTEESNWVFFGPGGATITEARGAPRSISVTEMTETSVSGRVNVANGGLTLSGPFTATRCDQPPGATGH